MKSSRVISAIEPLIVFGLVAAFTLVGFRSVSTVISRNVQPLGSLASVPEEPTPVAMANGETLTKRGPTIERDQAARSVERQSGPTESLSLLVRVAREIASTSPDVLDKAGALDGCETGLSKSHSKATASSARDPALSDVFRVDQSHAQRPTTEFDSVLHSEPLK